MSVPLQGLDPQLSEAIIGTISEPMIVLDQDLRVILASRAFYDKFKVQHKDTHNKLFYKLGNGQWNIPKLRTLLEEVVPQKKAVDGYEVTHDFERLGKRIMRINAREINYTSGQKKMLLTIQDITNDRANEEQKIQLMHQKDTLLKEMRHRIANSLQLIASIILLKSATAKSEESRLHLQEAHDRILSIATVQRNLDPTGDDAEVPVVEYLKTLCKSIAKTMIGGRKPIILTVNGGSGTADPDEAISIGLITTELVINALKHAFPSGEGLVTITYTSDVSNWKLSISDNGVGLAATTKENKEGLGSNIIDSLAKQLKADIGRTTSSRGTTVSISHSRAAPLAK